MNIRNMDYRRILKSILALVAAMFFAAGCAKEDPYEGALGLQSRRIVLPAEVGRTPIMVFSNTTWTASFSSEVTWAGIDKLSGKGSSCIYFSYSANYGEEREVTILFEADGVKDSVVVVQSAMQ